jgi:hypothetical protein
MEKTLTFGKYKGKKLADTPNWYQGWLKKQPWFVSKMNKAAQVSQPQNPAHALAGWDGYSRRGQAAYDAMFEMEKNEMIVQGLECECGLPKFAEEKYCEGDHCKFWF